MSLKLELPPFLTAPLPSVSTTSKEPQVPCRAIFSHNLGPAPCVWWNPQNGAPKTVLLFIPGNPGLMDFYIPFLSLIHNKDPSLAILGQAHLGHTPRTHATDFNLSAQIQSACEALDSLVATFGQAKVVIIGHSVGAWISLQVLKARPLNVSQIFLICPTICHIAKTPNGRTLSWLFRPPLPRLISWLTYATRPLPLSLFFSHWPTSQTAVLRSLLNSPASVYACLSMADDEMGAIRELDTALLDEYKHRLHFYFAEEDQWVGEYKYSILRSLKDGSVVHGQPGVPHAFCIDHSEEVATQCSSWLAL
ncbi:hypothetical protein C8J57DRAFT_1268958 [Mycena rebaudengoi]|nr:hypothetical protein C8J57DRAFT_1268958 [Mycena rebaudengoi]